MNETSKQDAQLFAKLNLETALFPWKELLRYFASGMVIDVSEELDLLEVAAAVSLDDTEAVKDWMFKNQIVKVSDDRALEWLQRDASVWTVVVKPWILVQDKELSKPAE